MNSGRATKLDLKPVPERANSRERAVTFFNRRNLWLMALNHRLRAPLNLSLSSTLCHARDRANSPKSRFWFLGPVRVHMPSVFVAGISHLKIFVTKNHLSIGQVHESDCRTFSRRLKIFDKSFFYLDLVRS